MRFVLVQCIKCVGAWGFVLDVAGGTYSVPDLLAGTHIAAILPISTQFCPQVKKTLRLSSDLR